MSRVPTFRDIEVDIRKLREYCLSEDHPRGRHKARVFRSRLGLANSDADFLKQALLDAAHNRQADLHFSGRDRHGRRYVLDFAFNTAAGSAVVRSGWIVPTGRQVLRFITCYVL